MYETGYFGIFPHIQMEQKAFCRVHFFLCLLELTIIHTSTLTPIFHISYVSAMTYLVSAGIRSCAKKQGDESRCGEYR